MPSKNRNRSKHTATPTPIPLPAVAPAAGPTELALTGERLALWKSIKSRYELESATEALLRNACESLERAAQMAAQVTTQGATFSDRFGQVRVNPAAQLEVNFRGLAERTLSKLAARLEAP